MSNDLTHSRPADARVAPVAAWVFLAALLAAELFGFTLHFNTGGLTSETAWWAQAVRAAPIALRLGLAALAAAVLLGHGDLWDELRRCESPLNRVFRRGVFLAGHFAALGLFLWISHVLLEGDLGRSSPFPAVWAAAWFIAGAATAAFWGLACLPAADWLRLLRRTWKSAAIGTVLGPLAYTIGPVANLLWEPFGRPTLVIVHALLSLLFPGHVVWDPAQFEIGTDAFEVQIWASCSGYAGVAMMVVFTAAYLWIFRGRLRFPAAFLMLPVGTAVVWLLNTVRLVLLIAIGSWGRPDVAMGGFHKNSGWLAFTAVALGLVLIVGKSSWISAAPREASRDRTPSPTTAYLGPFLAVLLTTMIAGAFSSGFDWLYPLRIVAAGFVLWTCRRCYAELGGGWSWQGPAFGLAAFTLWVFLAPAAPAAEAGWPAALTQAPSGWPLCWLGCRLAGYVVMAPLVEELAFRGYLTRRLTAAEFLAVPPGRFSWFAFVLSSLLFGAMHGRMWIAATASGMLFALAVRRRGRLIDAVLAHAATNALIAAYVFTTGNWALWA